MGVAAGTEQVLALMQSCDTGHVLHSILFLPVASCWQKAAMPCKASALFLHLHLRLHKQMHACARHRY